MKKLLRNKNIKTKILTLTLFYVVVIAIISALMIFTVQRFKSMTDEIDKASNRIYLATKMESTLNAMQVQSLSMFVNFDNAQTIKNLIAENDIYEAQFDSLYEEYSSVVLSREDAESLEVLSKAYYEGLMSLENSLEATAISRNENAFRDMASQATEYHTDGKDAVAKLISFNSDKIDSIRTDINRESTLITVLLVSFILAILIVSFILGSTIANLVSKPTNKLVTAALSIASGKADITLDINSEDEIGILAKAFERIVESFKEQTRILSYMAKGDFTVKIDIRSEKDVVNREINKIAENNSRLVSNIMSSSKQVLSGSQQISQDAQNLANGTTEQAGAIEHLSKYIDNILSQSEQNSTVATQAYNNTKKENALMAESMRSMNEMRKAMDEINQSSKDISKVIKVIEDIAFQTNILALNASVEASRAGSHGSGFSVVAGEVRNLASRSAEAARETAKLIEDSIKKVSEGSVVADTTNESLSAASRLLDSNAELMKSINDSSQSQNSSITEIKEFISKISAVVQMNSAGSEQSAASAQEITAQAENLNRIVSSFKITTPDDTPENFDIKGTEAEEKTEKIFGEKDYNQTEHYLPEKTKTSPELENIQINKYM